jgi:predicted RNA binding protein YcfA (HicA-like mRNA interferase family)
MKLPVVSARELIKALAKIGFLPHHQRGSHITLRGVDPPHKRLTIPNHGEIARGTLRAILDDAELTTDEFKQLLK